MIARLFQEALEWAAGHHDEGRYSPVAIVFHWSMVVLVIFQIGWGFWMGRQPVGGAMVAAYDVHFAVGILMLILVVGRLAWRLMAPDLVNDADKPGWESLAARVTHYVFYICLFGLPLSGWAMISATDRTRQLETLGFIPWPLMPLQDLSNTRLWAIEAAAEWMHWGLVLALLLMIPIHAGAALKHHLIDRDDVFHAMLPVAPRLRPRRTRWQRRWRALEKQVASTAKGLWRGFVRPKAT
ncbi:cytochrome b [Caulobacter segnis]|uniref:cytochrome b n=1 Tax=Caulobacter segnis TaxID=88688 RepID=UPI00241097F1|nr:cytochrome b [Caulobacter segnis]MDG2520686.1 cytochrome b [Caulobacter segnis]